MLWSSLFRQGRWVIALSPSPSFSGGKTIYLRPIPALPSYRGRRGADLKDALPSFGPSGRGRAAPVKLCQRLPLVIPIIKYVR